MDETDKPSAAPSDGALKLRASPVLAKVPSPEAMQRAASASAAPIAPVAPISPAASAAPIPAIAPVVAPVARPLPAKSGDAPAIPPEFLTGMNLALAGIAAFATLGWLYERRRRIAFTGDGTIAWAHEPHAEAKAALDKMLPDGPTPDESARSIYEGLGPANGANRRANLGDLQTLARSLGRRWRRMDWDGAQALIERHVADFRETSPWVFQELLLVLRERQRESDWEAPAAAFQRRFGQKAPAWGADLQAWATLADDTQLGTEISRLWPSNDSRHWISRWMLGDSGAEPGTGPPLLPLGVYRDMLLLDNVLLEAAPTQLP